MSVILDLVGLDVARPINCQVSAVSGVHLVTLVYESDGLQSKGPGHLQFREQSIR